SFFFFFSSRRRHTRWPRDWSSDVCSSDLGLDRLLADLLGDLGHPVSEEPRRVGPRRLVAGALGDRAREPREGAAGRLAEAGGGRSEERRVGKEGRARWWADEEEKKRSRGW